MLIQRQVVHTMTESSSLEQIAASNKRSLRRLTRAITLSEGQFALILVSCNRTDLREQVIKRLHKLSSLEIQDVIVPPSSQTLFTTIVKMLEGNQPEAIMVWGLEAAQNIEQLLTSTNLVRDEFRKRFPFPLVLWVNDEILKKLIRLAPDFKSFAASAIRFEVGSEQASKVHSAIAV